MNLVINIKCSYLTKLGDCFCVKKDERKSTVSAKKVESILILYFFNIVYNFIIHYVDLKLF